MAEKKINNEIENAKQLVKPINEAMRKIQDIFANTESAKWLESIGPKLDEMKKESENE